MDELESTCLEHLKNELLKASSYSKPIEKKGCKNPECFCTGECQEPVEYVRPDLEKLYSQLTVSYTVEDFKRVIQALPRSEGRVPYTYHHDYVRGLYPSMSRADVAVIKNWSEEELYATALTGLISGLDNIVLLSALKDIPDGYNICLSAKDIAENHVKKFAK